VGAAVRCNSGKIYTGANLENVSFGLTICAEASALSLANAGGEFAVEAIAVVGHKFSDPLDASRVVAPCGSCRQIIAEAALFADRDVRILCCNGELSSIVVSTIAELLPQAFRPEELALAHPWPALREKLHRRVAQLIELRQRR
jgi:cytidine deaminase